MIIKYDDILPGGSLLIRGGQLKIKRNTITVIQGKNGCGKTLFLKNIAFNQQNTDLAVILLDQDNGITPPVKDVVESIALSEDAEDKDFIRSKIKEMDCGFLLGLNCQKLSGGEQRLINILRCVCSAADILLLDEPTNDLDYIMVEKLLALLTKMKEIKTVIIVSHDDRAAKIADRIIEIEDRRIKDKKECAAGTEPERNSSAADVKISTPFIKKCFKYNYINVLGFIMLSVFVFLQVDSFKNVVNGQKQGTDIPEEQVFFLSIYSDAIEYCGNNILPAFTMRAADYLNPAAMADMANKVTEFYNSPNIEMYDLKLDSNSNYTVYPLEYISKDGKERINVFDYYLKKYHNNTKDEAYIDASKYFVDVFEGDIDSKYKYELDIDKYHECIDELEKEESLIVGAEVVVLNEGYIGTDLWEQKEIKNIVNHKVCVCSKETNILSYQLSLIQEVWGDIKVIVTASLILLIINLMFVRLQMTAIKKQIFFFKNFAVKCDILVDCMEDRMNNRIPGLIVFVLFCGGLMIHMRDVPFSQINFVFVICPMLYCSIMYQSENWLIDRYVKKYYRWEAR